MITNERLYLAFSLASIIAITPEGKYKVLAERRRVFGCGMRKAITSVQSPCRNSRRIMTWGDKDYYTLYITATTSVYRLETRAQGFVPYLEH